jgi:hypothetical protein
LGYPIYLATSRKNYIRDILGLPVDDLLEGTLAAVAYGVAQGAQMVRTHDVAAVARVIRMTLAIMRGPDGVAGASPGAAGAPARDRAGRSGEAAAAGRESGRGEEHGG